MWRLASACLRVSSRATIGALRAAIMVVLIGLLSATSRAGETWDGGGRDNNWTTDANWNANCQICIDSMPDNDGTADIRMAGTTRLTPRVDVDWDINSLTFNNTAGAFSISGDPGVSLGIGAGGITNNDAQLQILLLPIDLNASQTWNAAAGPLSIGNTVAGHPLFPRILTLDGANNTQILGAITQATILNKTGTGTLTFNGLNTNTYTGTTTVSAGTLVLNRTGGPNRAIPRNLVIGDGAGGAGADVVRLDAADQITEAAGRIVTVNNSGLLNLNGFNETLANLAINGGSLSGAGSLTVNEALTFTGGGTISTAILSAPASPAVVNSGLLNISSAGRISNTSGRIGSIAGSNGAVTVGGAGSTWSNSQDLTIGGAGTGTLNVTSGGQVTSTISYIGDNAGSTGEVNVDGVGSTWTNTGDLYVGNAGVGTLNITSGGHVSDSATYIGNNTGSTGEVVVDGVGSYWRSPKGMVVGASGDGTLNITGHGEVDSWGSNPGTFIGMNAGSSGTVQVDGQGQWRTSPVLVVGKNGSGMLAISNGGYVRSMVFPFDPQLVGHMDIGADGVVNVRGLGSFLEVDGPMTVESQGEFTISDGAEVMLHHVDSLFPPDLNGTAFIDGAATIDAGSLDLEDDLVISGVLTLRNGGLVGAMNCNVQSSGQLRGNGTVAAPSFNSGLVSPGESAGTLTIEGNYTQTADGELLIELAPTGHDQLLGINTATLGGTLTVHLLDGFTPGVGQTYTILTADDVDGTFASEVFPSVPNLAFDVIYNAQSIVLSVLSAIPGDYNGDGTVDAADYVVWRKTDGTPAGYNTWRANFGRAAGSGTGTFNNTAVPEPASLPVLSIIVVVLSSVRRRFRAK